MTSRQERALQQLIEDSISRILQHEDSGQYLKWIRSAFPTYNLTPPDRTHDEDAQRTMAMGIGRAIWNATPLPGNNFQPKPLPRPGRNDRCPCGSGKKYKKCCGLSGSLPDPQIDTGSILPIVMSLASPKQRLALAKSQGLPITVLIETAKEHYEEGHPRKAVECLQPTFAEPIKRPSREHSFALQILCLSYQELGHNRKELELLERVATAPNASPLRCDALLMLGDHRRAAGDLQGARQAWTLAKRDDPEVPGLGACEIKLLVAEGKPADALQRAAFWRKRVANQPNSKHELEIIDDLIEFLRAAPNAEEALDRLEAWFADARIRPIPRYTVTTDAGEAITLESRLRQMGLDENQMREAIESYEKSKEEPPAEVGDEPAAAADDIADDEADDEAPMNELAAPDDVTALDQKWRTVFLVGKPFGTQNQPMGEMGAFEASQVDAWLGFLETNPAAADSLDVLDDLATLLGGEENHQELFHAVIDRAATIVERAVAHAPDAELPWVIASNRPALRPLARLFQWHTLANDDASAIDMARFLVRINPDDNHGIRTVLMNAMLRAGDDTGALALAARYPDDVMGDMVFGRTLALVRTGDFAAAEEILRDPFTRESRIPEFLNRSRVTRPKIDPHGIALGGAAEAWCYRQEMRDVWKRSTGALEWLATTVERLAREGDGGEGDVEEHV